MAKFFALLQRALPASGHLQLRRAGIRAVGGAPLQWQYDIGTRRAPIARARAAGGRCTRILAAQTRQRNVSAALRNKEGAGNDGGLAGAHSLVCEGEKHTSAGIAWTMVLRLIACAPRRDPLLCHHRLQKHAPTSLAPATGYGGGPTRLCRPQSPPAPKASAGKAFAGLTMLLRPIASPPRIVTMRTAPFH